MQSGGEDPRGGDGQADTSKAVQFVTGSGHSCALGDNGVVKCWGDNGQGALGLGDTSHRGDEPNEMGDDLPAIDLGTGRTATAIMAGGGFTCALLDDATVKCWGDNGAGQLGLGDTSSRGDDPNEMGDNLPAIDLGTGRTATAITADWAGYQARICALLDDATVKCWGRNDYGQLGLGDTLSRGDEPNEMGDNLPTVDLGTGRTAIAIAAGWGYTCALLDDATVKCWGYNGFGELGLGDTALRGDEPNEMGDNLLAIDLGTGRTATAIAAGYAQVCALLDDATVKCWGYNQVGQGEPGGSQRGDEPNEMGDSLPAIDLGAGRTATAITRGGFHTCALLDDATVKCWGGNDNGELGLGDTSSRIDDPNEMGDNLPAVDLGTGRTATAISTRGSHTCALLDDATVKCWGSNESGQLGLGDISNRGDELNEMGDALPAVDLTF